mmetsp:Transcript_8199/g.18962  ORF Transcript_8199/g.18962 Transcript_8199/m.18962 type:complete len:460 (-) Transcript_8199:11-1390(-)
MSTAEEKETSADPNATEKAVEAAKANVETLNEALEGARAREKKALAAARRADRAKMQVKAAEAYDYPFQMGLRFDNDWPAQPPTVRFQCVFHHGLVDDSGGMLMPFYRTLLMGDKDKFTILGILEAVHQFLIDPLKAWGIPVDSTPQRLTNSLLANQQMNEARLSTMRKYSEVALHKELFESPPKWREEWFDPSFWKASQENTPESWRAVLTEHLKDEIFHFKLFTNEFCDMFVEEIFNFYSTGLPAKRPNSMNNYGIILNEIGLEPMIDALQELFQPLGELLFPGPGSVWDGHHCFIVRYRAGEDLGLDMHTDDSDVTFNVCLGLDFTGAGLQFCGLMGSGNHRRHTSTYMHEKGTVVVHLGRKRHGADDISSGERLNLILWNHSSTYRMSEEYRHPPYVKEVGAPDEVCVSYTHDRDFGIYKDYPVGKEKFKGRGWCPPKAYEYDDFKADAEAQAGG